MVSGPGTHSKPGTQYVLRPPFTRLQTPDRPGLGCRMEPRPGLQGRRIRRLGQPPDPARQTPADLEQMEILRPPLRGSVFCLCRPRGVGDA